MRDLMANLKRALKAVTRRVGTTAVRSLNQTAGHTAWRPRHSWETLAARLPAV